MSKYFSSVLTGPGGTPGTGGTGGTPGTRGTLGTGGSPVTGDMTGGSTGWCSHIINSYIPSDQKNRRDFSFLLEVIVFS